MMISTIRGRDRSVPIAAVCLLAVVSVLRAQAPARPAAPAGSSDRPSEYSEYGIRFTPGMANGMARLWTNEVLVRHYEMDSAKADEATEAVARRLMKLAHTDEVAGQELAEYTITTLLDTMAKRRQENLPFIPPELAQGVAQRLLPLMPAVREMMDGVVDDVRPMLGLKGQLKLAGELVMVKTGMDAFEKNMQKWAKGEVDPFGNPFRGTDDEVKKQEDGQSRQLQNAVRTADMVSGRGPGDDWDRYVEDAKKYYDLDPSQQAAVDSLLREYKQRALSAVGGADQWRASVYRNRLWWSMSTNMPGRWNSPLRTLLDRDYARVREPVASLGHDLMERIEEIPTLAQREAAEQRLRAALAEKGLDFDLNPKPPAGLPPANSAPPAEPVAADTEDTE